MSTSTFSVRIEDALREQYDQLAQATDRSRNDLMKDALEQYAAEKLAKIALVQEGLDQLQAGRGIPHDEVIALLQERGILPRDTQEGV
ncbi:MAG TPA: ribbon-helix-helix protein, CopG family [Chloroflexota bacterium]|nr:ribbon-helix-helix protein, CopG family [Chloroflexota bacterium]